MNGEYVTHLDILSRLSDQRPDDIIPTLLEMAFLCFSTSNSHPDALLTSHNRLSKHDLVFIVRPLDERRIELVLNLEVSRGIENSKDDEGEASRGEHLDSLFLLDNPFEVFSEFDELA